MGLFRKKGGGFLNGVNGVIESYKFDSKTWGEGEKAYTKLSVELNVKQDGADEAVQQFVDAGFLYEDDGQGISDDCLTLTGGAQVGEDSDFARLVSTIIEHGGPSEDDFLDADGNGTNFEPMLGWRYTFGKELNTSRQIAAGRKKLGAKAAGATNEEIMSAGRRQDRNDKKKFYNHDRLVVTAVLGKVEDSGSKKAAGKAKATTAATGTKPKFKPVDDEFDYDAADALLIGFLADAKNNTIAKASISSLVVRKALEDDMPNEERDVFRKLLQSDTYLEREAGWTFDSNDKKQPVTLAKKKKK